METTVPPLVFAATLLARGSPNMGVGAAGMKGSYGRKMKDGGHGSKTIKITVNPSKQKNVDENKGCPDEWVNTDSAKISLGWSRQVCNVLLMRV